MLSEMVFLRRLGREFFGSLAGRFVSVVMLLAMLIGYWTRQDWLAPVVGVVAFIGCIGYTAVRLYIEGYGTVIFVPHRPWKSRLIEAAFYSLLSIAAIAIIVFVPRPTPALVIPEWAHFEREEIGTKHFGSKQLLVANLYWVNDGPTADIKISWGMAFASGKERNSARTRDEALRRIRTNIAWSFAKDHKWNTIRSNPHDHRFFSIIGPLLTPSQMKQFSEGKHTFYVVGVLVVKNNFGTKQIEFCGYNQGVDFRVIIVCPEKGGQ